MTLGIGVEDAISATWIMSTLSGDTALMTATPGGVHDGPAPDGTAYPLVEFEMMSSIEVQAVGAFTIMQNQVWIVRAVNEGTTYLPCVTPTARIYSLLHRRQGVIVTGGTIESSTRIQTLRQQPIQGGREVRVLASLFRIYTQGN